MQYQIDWHLKKWMQENLIQNTAIVIDIDNGTVKDALYINLAKDENLVKYIRTQGNAMIFYLTPQGEIALGIQDSATEPAATPPTGAREAEGVVHPEYNLGIFLGKYRHAPADGKYRITACGHLASGEFAPDDLQTLDMCPDCVAARIETLPNVGNTTPQPATDGAGDGEPVYAWELTSDGTEVPRVYNDKFDFNLDSYSEALDLLHVLREYESETAALKSELAAARERIAELTRTNAELATEAAANGDTANDYKREAEHLKTVRDGLQNELRKLKINAQMVAKNALELETKLDNAKAEIGVLRNAIKNAADELRMSDDDGREPNNRAIRNALDILTTIED